MSYNEEDLVFCTVKKIDKTTVFVELESKEPGSIIFPEIAAGRIRNIREYAYPGKKIVCKILSISPQNIELSLRRVSGKERENFTREYEKERNFTKMLSLSVKNPKEIVEKIKEKYAISEFLEEITENPSLVLEYLSQEESQKLLKILSEKKEREKIVRTEITLSSTSPSGLLDIQAILQTDKAKISYLGSSKFLIEVSSPSFKDSEKKLSSLLIELAEKAKTKSCNFEIKQKK